MNHEIHNIFHEAWIKLQHTVPYARSKSTECIFVGYPDGVKGYRLIDLSSD